MDVVVDLAVSFERGSNVASVTPRTDDGRAWLRSAPFEPWQRLGDAVGVDVRLVDRLISDAEADGLVVEEV
jgi:hypothetical protein